MVQASNNAPESAALIDMEEGPILFQAEFADQENLVGYYAMWFILVCIGFTLLYGIGIFGFFWLPVMYTIWRTDYQNRRLYITPENVVYKTNIPVCCPCFGSTKREKHVLLSLITDVILEQGCMQARYGLQSLKIENAGQASPNSPGADLAIVGISNAKVFKQAVLAAAAAKRSGMQITTELIQASLTNGYLTGVPVATAPMGAHPFAPTPAPAYAPPTAAAAADPSLLQNLYHAQQESNRTLREVATLLEKFVEQQPTH